MFRQFGGRFINLSNVRCIDMAGTNDRVSITYTDGEREQVKENWANLHDLLAPVVAAEAGFSVIMVAFEEGAPTREGVITLPVVAWRVTDQGAEAVTPDDILVRGSNDREAIRAPNGSVIEPMVGRWRSIDLWLDHVRRDWEKWRQQQSRKANP